MTFRYLVIGLGLALSSGALVACGDDDGGSNNLNNQNNDNGNTNDNQNNNNNATTYGCTEACTDMAAAGCSQGPPTPGDCVPGCEAAQVQCPTELAALLDCAAPDPVVTCDASGNVVYEGCEAENDAIEACMNEPPQGCEDACPGVVAAACENGPPDLEECLAGCQQTVMTCPDEWQDLLDCAGAEPQFECNDSGAPQPVGCAAENDVLYACLYDVPQICVDVCPDVVAAGCTSGPPDVLECWSGCGEAMMGCPDEWTAWVDCGGTDPQFTCDVEGSVTIEGCETEMQAIMTCMGG